MRMQVIAGGYAQAQATYLGSAARQWTGFGPLEAVTLPAAAWLLNVVLVALPAAYAARCWWLL